MIEGYRVARAFALDYEEKTRNGLLAAVQAGKCVAEFEVCGREVTAVALDGAPIERGGLLVSVAVARDACALEKNVSLLPDDERTQDFRLSRLAHNTQRFSFIHRTRFAR